MKKQSKKDAVDEMTNSQNDLMKKFIELMKTLLGEKSNG
jgi:hypothetical protein